jgi:hypothetical protein
VIVEWLLLVLVVPAVLVPLVLLGGFAGCSILYDPDNLPEFRLASPTNFTARGVSVSAIALAWNDPNTVPVTFQIERTRQGESAPERTWSVSGTGDEDSPLDEGTAYFYKVRAVRAGGGPPSDPAEASATTFARAFAADLATDQAGLAGFCVIQRIEPTRLQASGARVSITVRGSTAGPLRLDRVFISQPAVTGDPTVSGNPYDAHADLTQVASAIDVPASTPVTLPTIDYAFDHTRPVLIAFDIGTPGNVRFLNPVPASDARMFFKPTTAEAGIRDRQPPKENPNAQPFALSASIYLVERIHVGS